MERRLQYDRSLKLNNGRRILHGIVAKADTLTLNKRLYPKAILKREVSLFQKHIRKGTSVGELDHPDYLSPYYQHLTLSTISHRVLKLEWRGPNLIGTIEILPTACGTLIWDLFSHGFALGASLRGWSSVLKDKKQRYIVQNNFKLVTFDLVPVPAFPEGYLAPYPKKFDGKLPDYSSLVQLAAVGYGAILPQSLIKLLDPGQIVETLKKRHLQSNAVEKGNENYIPSIWSEEGCTLAPGSYVTVPDNTGKYLKGHVPGTRELAKHAVNFVGRTLKNNGIHSISKKTLKGICSTYWMQPLASTKSEVACSDKTTYSCSWRCFPWLARALRFAR